jgi:hypothetical protein
MIGAVMFDCITCPKIFGWLFTKRETPTYKVGDWVKILDGKHKGRTGSIIRETKYGEFTISLDVYGLKLKTTVVAPANIEHLGR